MEILAAPPGRGKTTKLVNDMLDNPASVIVVSTTQRKSQMRVIVEMVMRRRGLLRIERVPLTDVVFPQPSPSQRVDEVMERVITCDDIQSQRFGRRDRLYLRAATHVMVDDVEDVLYFWIGADVATATVSVR